MTAHVRTIRLEFHSSFDFLDLVQIVSDYVGRALGFDDDSLHWVGVSVRESVINAIQHGNEGDASKRVFVEFTSTEDDSAELVVAVRDQGKGFDPDELPDPLAPENLLKTSGRGIFFMKSFMDEVAWRRRLEGGMEVRMVKRLDRDRGSGIGIRDS